MKFSSASLSTQFALALPLAAAGGCDPDNVFGCTDPHPNNQAPAVVLADFDYTTDSMRAWVGVPVAPNVATVDPTPVGFTISPALPAGMTLDPVDGTIAGAPTVPLTSELFSVVAEFGGTAGVNDTVAQFTLEVFDAVAPSGFGYQPNSLVVAQSDAIPVMAPSYVGVAQSFTVAPPLPLGIQLNPQTGFISGVCSANVGVTQHVVTLSNPIGSTQTTIDFEVLATPRITGLLVGSLGDQTTDVFELRGTALTPIDAEYLLGAGPIASVQSIDGRFVYIASTNGHVYRESLDPVTGLSSPPIDLGSFGAVYQLVIPPSGAHLYMIKDFSVERWSIQPDGSLCCSASVAGPFAPGDAVAVNDDLLVVGASSPGSAWLYDLTPTLALRGQPLDFGPDVSVRGLASVPPGKFVVAATSKYDFSTHDIIGRVRSLKLATDTELAAGKAAIEQVDTFTTGGGDLSSIVVEGLANPTLLVTDSTLGRVYRFDIDNAGDIVASSNFNVGGHPSKILASPDGALVYVLDSIREEIGVYDSSTGGLSLVARNRTRRQPAAMLPLFRVLPSAETDVAFATSAADSTVVAIRCGAASLGTIAPAAQGPIATGATPMDVAVSSGGAFVYTANRDGASISAFRFDTAPALQLTPIETEPLGVGARPRSLAITRGGAFLYALDESLGVVPHTIASDGSLDRGATTFVGGDLTDALVRVDVLGRFLFVVQPNAGAVTSMTIDLPSGFAQPGVASNAALRPVDLWLSPDGRFAYILDQELGRIVVCTIDVVGGDLSPTGTSFFLGGSPTQIVDPFPIDFALPPTGANDLIVPDLVGPGVDGLTRNLLSGALAANSLYPGALPAPNAVVRGLQLGAGTNGLLCTSDDGVVGRLHTLDRDATTHAFVELDQSTIGREPHALAVHTRFVP